MNYYWGLLTRLIHKFIFKIWCNRVKYLNQQVLIPGHPPFYNLKWLIFFLFLLCAARLSATLRVFVRPKQRNKRKGAPWKAFVRSRGTFFGNFRTHPLLACSDILKFFALRGSPLRFVSEKRLLERGFSRGRLTWYLSVCIRVHPWLIFSFFISKIKV